MVRTIGTHSAMRARRKFAMRFALLVRTLLREACVNSASSYHGKLPVQAVADCWYPLKFAGHCSGFHWQPLLVKGKLASYQYAVCSLF